MKNFEEHYQEFLGIKKENSDPIISCKRRDDLFCLIFKQILIVSSFNDTLYYSIAPQYYSSLKRNFEAEINPENLTNLFFEIDDYFCNILDRYQIDRYYRLSNPDKPEMSLPIFDKIITLDESNKDLYFRLIGERGPKFKERQWLNRQKLILDKRYFILIENNEIAAYSFISDLDFGGANIGIVTLPKYRQKGYGKALVSKAIDWCNRNEIRPIYLVNQQNNASINLAKSLGFKVMSNEIIVTVQG